MAFIPTPDGARVVINWVKGSETFSYVYYATKAGYDQAAQQQLADAVAGVHNAALKAWFAAQVTYQNVTVYDARESDGVIVTSVLNTGPGTASQEALPINTAVCVTVRTAGRGRSSRGRKYITGFSEGHSALGEWAPAAVSSALNYVNYVHNSIVAAGWQPVIRSIQQDGVHLTIAATRAITSVSVRNSKVATQRRRVDRP